MEDDIEEKYRKLMKERDQYERLCMQALSHLRITAALHVVSIATIAYLSEEGQAAMHGGVTKAIALLDEATKDAIPF